MLRNSIVAVRVFLRVCMTPSDEHVVCAGFALPSCPFKQFKLALHENRCTFRSIPQMALSFKDIHAAGRSFGCKGILKIATESISW